MVLEVRARARPRKTLKINTDPESLTNHFFFFFVTPTRLHHPSSLSSVGLVPSHPAGQELGGTLGGLCFVELIMRTQQGENQRDASGWEVFCLRQVANTPLCAASPPLFSHFSRTKRVPFVTCLHLEFFKKPPFIDSPRLSVEGFIVKQACSSHQGFPPSRSIGLIKGAPFKMFTLLPFHFDSTNTL